MCDLLEVLEDKDVSINVISKSGTTTETSLAFRIFKEFLEIKYGNEEANKRIYATTDRENGVLKIIAEKKGYETFAIPEDIGGRYSLLTAVGLLPIAVSGIDIKSMMNGAFTALQDLNEPRLDKNPAYQYAAIRNLLYLTKG
jgi:glucose-6-phosphate isomerase